MGKIEKHAQIVRYVQRWIKNGLTSTAGALMLEEQEKLLLDAVKGPDDGAKYRDGEKTWSGRGRKPKWLLEQLKEGRSLEEFLAVRH